MEKSSASHVIISCYDEAENETEDPRFHSLDLIDQDSYLVQQPQRQT